MNFAVSVDHRVKLKESEKRDKYLHLGRELDKKNYGIEKVTVIPIVTAVLGETHKRFGTVTGRLGRYRTSRAHLGYSNYNVHQNTEKGPADLRILAVTQTSEKPSANADVKNTESNNNYNDYN